MSDLYRKRAQMKKAATPPKAEPLNERARAARVLGSQSRPQTVLGCLDDKQIKTLAAFCDGSGGVKAVDDETPAQVVNGVMAEYARSLKPRVEKGKPSELPKE